MSNILLVEDHPEQITKMKLIIESAEQHYNFYYAVTAREGLEQLTCHKMDLVILDIELPDKSGIELAQDIRKIPGYEFVWIVFLTMYKQHITEAFKKTHCYDYITKPYDAKEVISIIERLSCYKITQLSENDQEFVTFKQKDLQIRVLTKDLLYVEVLGNNSTLYTYSQVFFLKKMSLKKLKLILPDNFVQCHKSYLVNSNYIESFQKNSYGWEINLKNYATRVPIGEKYKDSTGRIAGIVNSYEIGGY